MKIIGVVGWLEGRDGTGNVFEVIDSAGLLLAMIWADGKFHFLPLSEFNAHAKSGKAGFIDIHDSTSQFLEKATPAIIDGIINVENPVGWERFYTQPAANEPAIDGADAEPVNVPVSFSFTGNLKISIGGLSKILSILD